MTYDEIPKDINGREIILATVTGSYNYHLNEEGSDKDWHILVTPTFNDVYHAKLFTKAEVTSTLDYTAWDLRRFPEQLWKSNPNVLEMLFSESVYYPSSDYEGPLRTVFEDLRDDVTCMNLPYLFNASMGIAHCEIKELDKRNPDLLQEFGYNTKVAMHAYRTLENLDMFAQNGFEDFGSVIHCDNDRRNRLLAIKHGEVYEDIDDARMKLEAYKQEVYDSWSGLYLNARPDKETYAKLEEVCMQLFRIWMGTL